jgi:hypothetical protein
MWNPISAYVLAVYTIKKVASFATFEHKQPTFMHGKHSLVLPTICPKNHKQCSNFGSVFSPCFSQVTSSEIFAVYFLFVSHK